MFDEILEYDIYSKIDSLNTKYKNHSRIQEYKLYKKFYNLISSDYIAFIRQIQSNKERIDPLYYNDILKLIKI
jgi:hypothetical protein